MNGEEKEGDPIEDTGDPLFGADEGADTETGGGRAADDTPDEPTRKVRLPSSCGLTVLVDVRARTRSPAELGRLRHHSSTPGGGVSRRGPTIRSGVAQAAMATHAGRAATFKLAIPALRSIARRAASAHRPDRPRVERSRRRARRPALSRRRRLCTRQQRVGRLACGRELPRPLRQLQHLTQSAVSRKAGAEDAREHGQRRCFMARPVTDVC